MSSGGSNLERGARSDEIQSSKSVGVESSEALSKDNNVCSMQTSDMLDKPRWDQPAPLVTIHNLTFDPVRIRRELAKSIILHDYPFSIINHMGFKGLLFDVYPEVSQNTLRSDILKIYEFEKNCSRALLYETKSRIAVTTHKWISCDRTKKYIAITGHIIDDNWEVQRCMIRFVNVPCIYTSDFLTKITLECLFDLEVTAKLSSIAIENDSYDVVLADALIDKLSSGSLLLGGKLLRTECFAHTVSSMVKVAFAVIGDVIKKIREIIIFWTATPQRERQFKQASHRLGIKCSNNNLVLDSVSKWNTTFLMLQTALLYKTIFCHLKEESSEISSMPSEEEWKLVEEIYQRLELFYTTIKSVPKYQTANLVLLLLCETKLALSKWVQCDNVLMREMALRMLDKFNKYWHTVRDTFAVAAVLDPRLQLDFVSFYFKEIYGDGAQSEVECIRQVFYDLFNEYKSKLDSEKINGGDTSPPRPGDSADRFAWYKWHNRHKRKRKDEKHEFDKYLERENFQVPGSIEDFDLLGWWNMRTEYPTLKKMARDILAIPICSVPPENMFDIDESVLSPNRSRLDLTMVETLMCTQSWLWTNIKGCYSITNSYLWGTSVDHAAEEDHAGE